MLNEGKLIISECESCGSGETQNVEELARDLRAREAAEIREADETAVQYQNNCNIAGSTIIYDSRGAHIKQ